MAAEIKPAVGGQRTTGDRKLTLLAKVEGFGDDVHDAVFIDGEDGIITASDDKSVRVWLRRDTGQFWPSVCHYMPSPTTCLFYHASSHRLFVGLDNGTVCEFHLATDYNRLSPVRDYLAHQARVTACLLCPTSEWTLSVSRDKTFQYHCTETGRRLGGHQTDAWCTAMQYDMTSKHVFVGDYSGLITMLKLDESGPTLITKLNGHTGSIGALSWDAVRQWLFSGSYDQNIIVWDIGGRQGTAYELQGHTAKILSLCYHAGSRQLLSASEDGSVVVWNMAASRRETPSWNESDVCQLCSKPFFWNLRAMYDNKQLGLNRQHHCRNCGRAVCDACSSRRCTIPPLGFELPVRLCEPCFTTESAAGHTPLASIHEAKHRLVTAAIDGARLRYLTVGQDRLVKVWELAAASS
ncbi:WD repeat and FYVE domain-containing protein 2-like [Amphibalanus amphitrite]|uniref:WD repeat and FYVE domain-containing protein 2-like n=1 Tax=Amphibalanus amphitrite TaxID=1232801 RepID=UPI001C918031|nr:WD repeat and FYVE domain-containing protein 2-like [Amphibalanus amphitrite]XP_043242593.1 WD repeat and FYVE domain-containing protein 2-like [Amphibalanus amphitrite]XP_043242594.1 WD repeat and FYVE domain-containing protein 2-like [Amphibalanus amphitrite]XP_043242595.1 WD repeat and FYVE domain-containing protein 2-like [Amphibalanus amphitrite]